MNFPFRPNAMILPLHGGVLLVICLFVNRTLAKDRRVQGGSDTTIEEYPFIVSIRYPSNGHKCGGSLISRQWVLTAAHCVQKDVGSVQYGVTRISRDGKNVVGVEKVIYHEQFNVKGRLENDIALIKLSRPLELNGEVGIVKLPVPFQQTPHEYPSTIVGWGTNVTKGFLQNTLQKLTYKIVDCANFKHPYISGTNICAKEFGEEKGQCHGDSGGPLLVDDLQVGIASWIYVKCGNPNFPDILTRVASFTQWIAIKTGRNFF